MEIIIMIAVAFIGGVVGGMGMGGGTLLIPLLTVFCSVPQHLAQSLNLLAFIPMSVVAVILHAKNKLIEFPYLLLGIPALLSSVFASFLANNSSPDVLRKGFGIFLAILGIVNLAVVLIKKYKEKKEK
ncbi:MAG: TSUP family transporter [Clostridia bacterium]|nr:TSUP family transporter [Clostridia bacterium]